MEWFFAVGLNRIADRGGSLQRCFARPRIDDVARRSGGRAVKPSTGIVQLTIDGHVTIYQVELPEGIDPGRDEQPYRVIESSDVSAVV